MCGRGQCAGAGGIKLGVFFDDFDLATVNFHGAVGGVLKSHGHAFTELIRIGGERPRKRSERWDITAPV